MGIGAGLYMYDVVVQSSRSLSHLLMSSCCYQFLANAVRLSSVTHVHALYSAGWNFRQCFDAIC